MTRTSAPRPPRYGDASPRGATCRLGRHQHNRDRYDQTAATITAIDQTPPLDLPALTQAAQPILTTWRPNRTGPEQPIYAAVDRLRATIQRTTNPVR